MNSNREAILRTRDSALEVLLKHVKKLRDELTAVRNHAELTLKSNVFEMPDIRVIQEYVGDLKSLLASSPIVEQREFLKSFVQDIKVEKDTITINYTLPMPPLNSDREVVAVLPFIQHGRPYRSRTCDTLIKSQTVS